MNRPPQQVLDAVLLSLRENRDDWDVSLHKARNEKIGAEVWIANRLYGLQLQIPGAEWGGVTTAGTFFGRFMPWRRQLLDAVREIGIARFLDRVAAQTTTGERK